MPKCTLLTYNNFSGKTMLCSICDYSTRSNTGMRLHEKMKHGINYQIKSSRPKVKCGGCDKFPSLCYCGKK